MNVKLLRQHIAHYLKWMDTVSKEKKTPPRDQRAKYYQSWTKDLILKMTEEEIYEYISKLWAMLIWKNKRYVVDKLIKDNGFENVKQNLAELIWGDAL